MSVDSFLTSGNSPGARRCRVAILGFGTVGSAVASRLGGPAPAGNVDGLELTQILDRRAFAKRDALADRSPAAQCRPLSPDISWTTSIDDILSGDAEIFVPAFQFGPFTTPSTDLVE